MGAKLSVAQAAAAQPQPNSEDDKEYAFRPDLGTQKFSDLYPDQSNFPLTKSEHVKGGSNPDDNSSSDFTIRKMDKSGAVPPHELILQVWASCRAKGVGLLGDTYRADPAEASRQRSLQWRGRRNFVQLDCGEDSFFVADDQRTLGVADGVGGWRSMGVDPGIFANAIMKYGKYFAEQAHEVAKKKVNPSDPPPPPTSFVKNPAQILEDAYDKIVKDGRVEAGSSTVCCATLGVEEASSTSATDASSAAPAVLKVTNLGDSGAMVLRNGEIIHRTRDTTHRFNTPKQVGIMPKEHRGLNDSITHDATHDTIPVKEGDVILLATDGVFDNRFAQQLAIDVSRIRPNTRNSRAGAVGQQEAVDEIVERAWRTSHDQFAMTPWAKSLLDLGVQASQGGKRDDITVLVGVVTRPSDFVL